VLRRTFGPKRDDVTGVEKNCIMRSFMFVLFAKDNLNNQVKEDEMGGTCSMNGGEVDVGGKAKGKETGAPWSRAQLHRVTYYLYKG
jgi:hypothetical protein